ncbi:Type 1 glutamine amidotransferase-like domain-containing protein [Alloiococcus sp. CFN-8]|uniref:Type 1 glutamine amidotransferase-like domain-containing protein n=1 Tax=Alloiococcus sp. CFN-8 TaxID=3416081 RepID=UPI003CF64290
MIKILTSGFDNGFPDDFSRVLKLYIKSGMNLVFVASEFEKIYEKTDWYCKHFLNMFSDCGITFDDVKVIDGRLSKEKAQEIVKAADVLWLAGGDTPTQFGYLKAYGLIPLIREHKGVVIGMSAGAINMAKTAVCTLTCEHDKQEIYEALGLVDFSVEPHLDKDNVSEELLELSKEHSLYGICDEGAIICTDNDTLFEGDIFLIDNGHVTKVL